MTEEQCKKLKVGDRVEGYAGYSFDPIEGVVKEVSSNTCLVKVISGTDKSFHDNHDDSWCYRHDDLKLIEPVKEEEKYVKLGKPLEYGDVILKSYLDLIKESSPSLTTRTMRKLSELSASVRRAFSPEQRKLYKAGFIDSCGKYTEAAKDEVLNVLCDEHKEKLVEFAKEAIETAKEDKEDDE